MISKDRATPPSVPFIGPFFYAYTVFVGDDSFTVTEPNDMSFLEYFYDRCIAEDEDHAARGAAPTAAGPDQAHLPLDGAAGLNGYPTLPTASPASPARSLRNSAHP